MKKLSLILIVSIFAFSCENLDLPSELPNCIEDQIKSEVYQGPKREPNKAHVDAYFYNGEKVYIFDPGSGYADWLFTAYNQDCEVICEFGGISSLNTCTEFDNNSEYLGVIWEDPR